MAAYGFRHLVHYHHGAKGHAARCGAGKSFKFPIYCYHTEGCLSKRDIKPTLTVTHFLQQGHIS